jgi:hypothetical protein
MSRKLFGFGALSLCLLLASSVQAVPILTLGFGAITANGVVGPPTGEAQFFVDVEEIMGSPMQVKFVFRNTGPLVSSITDIYFDDGTLLGIASIDNADPGVAFSEGANPKNLPAANNVSPPFEAIKEFNSDADPPPGGPNGNGVNPGESVAIIFDLMGGGVVQDILDELADGRLRIGLHAQSFGDGESESFVNVPEPATLGLLSLGALGLLRRRRK